MSYECFFVLYFLFVREDWVGKWVNRWKIFQKNRFRKDKNMKDFYDRENFLRFVLLLLLFEKNGNVVVLEEGKNGQKEGIKEGILNKKRLGYMVIDIKS